MSKLHAPVIVTLSTVAIAPYRGEKTEMSNARKLTSTKELKSAMRNCPIAHPDAEYYEVLCVKLKDAMGALKTMAEAEDRNFGGYCFEPVYVSYRDLDDPHRWIEFGESHQTDEDIFIMQAMWD